MNRQQKKAVGYVGVFLSALAIYTLVYNWGMAALEGRPQSLIRSLVIVTETFTTTGYGEDAPWETSIMGLLMVTMQFTGVLLLFTTFPLFIVPWMEARLRPSVPTTFEGTNHVVICSYTSRGEALREELESWDRKYVFVESDRESAEELHDRDVPVVHGDPESSETLANAGVGNADVVVADATDEANASIILAAEEVDPDVRILSFVEDVALADYIELAGADEVFSPRQLLGTSLAEKVTTAVTTELGETVGLGREFEVVELSIQRDCPVCDTTLAESGIRERTGASIIGAWSQGEFHGSPEPETRLDEDTILLVAGSTSQLERLKELTLSKERRLTNGTVVVAGFGEVGSTVVRGLSEDGVEATVVDHDALPSVDVVGDVRDRSTLREAGVTDAGAVILALGDDTTTVFATLVIRELDPTVQIVARANESENVGKIYRAGADYVLALETISGRLLASTILDEEVMSFDRQVKIVRTTAPALAGLSLEESDVRSKTGCTVIAVERDDSVITDLDPEFRIQHDDALVIAGTDDAVNRFNEHYK